MDKNEETNNPTSIYIRVEGGGLNELYEEISSHLDGVGK